GSGLYGNDYESNKKIRLFKDGLLNSTLEKTGEYPYKVPIDFKPAGLWPFPIINLQLYIPQLLGEPLPEYEGYNPEVNPGIDMFFSNVAYRYAHGAVNSVIFRVDENGDGIKAGHLLLRDSLFEIEQLIKHGIEPILRGMAISGKQLVDLRYVEDLRSKLPFNGPLGYDLLAATIQRSRELGIRKYNEARISLDLPPASTWSDISSDVKVQDILKSIYGKIENLEAFVGCLAEDHIVGSVGPLMHASIKEQFIRLRDGDKNWYQNPGVLSESELDELANMTLGNLITQNTEIETFASNPFHYQKNRLNILANKPDTDSKNAYTVSFDQNFKLVHSIDETNNLIKITVYSNYTGWFSFGFGSFKEFIFKLTQLKFLGENMEKIDAFLFKYVGKWEVMSVAAVGTGIVNDVTESPIISDILDITDEKKEALCVISFTRKLVTGDARFVDFKNELQWISYAAAMEKYPYYHGSIRGAVKINFFESVFVDTHATHEEKHSKVATLVFHGLSMTLLFGVFFPLGIFVAKYYTDAFAWLKIHQMFMSIIVSDTLITTGTALVTNSGTKFTLHSYIGLSLAGLIISLLFSGTISSKAPHPSILFLFGIFRNYHKWIGYATFLLGISNMFLGAKDLVVIAPQLPVILPYLVVSIPIICYTATTIFGELRKRNVKFYSKNRFRSNKNVLPAYTWEEINFRVSSGSSKWIIMGDTIFDVQSYMDRHPGGYRPLQMVLGLEATSYFCKSKLKNEETTKTVVFGESEEKTQQRCKILDKLLAKDVEVVDKESLQETQRSSKCRIVRSKNSSTENSVNSVIFEKYQYHEHSRLAMFNLAAMAIGKIELPKSLPSITRKIIGSLNSNYDSEDQKNNFVAIPFKPYVLFFSDRTQVTKDNAKFKVIRLELSIPSGKSVSLAPGKHVEFCYINEEGVFIFRPYTAVRYINNGKLEFYIKIYGGLMTSYLNKATSVRVSFPKDSNEIRKDFANALNDHGCWKNLGLISGGNGLTFMLNLLEYHLFYWKKLSEMNKAETNIVLYNLNHSQENTFGYEHVQELVDAFNGRLKVVHHLTIAFPKDNAETGKIDGKKLKEVMPDAKSQESAVFICGCSLIALATSQIAITRTDQAGNPQTTTIADNEPTLVIDGPNNSDAVGTGTETFVQESGSATLEVSGNSTALFNSTTTLSSAVTSLETSAILTTSTTAATAAATAKSSAMKSFNIGLGFALALAIYTL
ncbi:hypothetical protein HDU92_004869, partial [Lobulomyces angularis]